eukprot:TRINITY_DN77090_c0_g1_i1.p3 TRINITY_DN77090_c0_g1~~TRINITY_DN77090_c0_g1_i1.p3  ORF type:complete len:115 (-),score=16.47 TRINITY_DN77090_c0_g1_i1:87-431(-)
MSPPATSLLEEVQVALADAHPPTVFCLSFGLTLLSILSILGACLFVKTVANSKRLWAPTAPLRRSALRRSASKERAAAAAKLGSGLLLPRLGTSCTPRSSEPFPCSPTASLRCP